MAEIFNFPIREAKAQVRTKAKRRGVLTVDIPPIDVETPLSHDEQVKSLARMFDISEDMLDMPMSDDDDTKKDPHDIGELAERLADAFNSGDLPMIRREFERRSPLYAAALSLAVLSRLRPMDRKEFTTMMNRMARP